MTARRVLGIDVGGSSVKLALIDCPAGQVVAELPPIPTPQPATPSAVLDAIAAAVAPALRAAQPVVAAGLAVPSVVKQGRARTAAHIDTAWIGFDAAAALRERLGVPVACINDADAAGIAEMRLGAGRGLGGVVFVLTFGTGIGTAPFIDGRLLPNTELGHLLLPQGEGEDWASARARTRDNLDFPTWAARVNDYLGALQRLFWPDAVIIGGGISDEFARFGHLLRMPARILPAQFRSQAGVVGAALAAAEALD